MPDNIVDPTPVENTPVADPAPVDDTPVASPRTRGGVPAKNSSEAFDNTVAEVKAELEAKEKAELEAAKAAEEPEEPEEEDEEDEEEPKEKVEPSKSDDEDEEEDEEEPKEKVEPSKPEEEPEEEEDKTTDAERVLALLKNPELLQKALEQAGVESALEIPFIKDVLGRNSQSVADQIKNEVARQKWEAENIQGVIIEGQKAQKEAIEVIEKLAKDFEEGLEDVTVPDADWLKEHFEKFADGALHAYHNQTFDSITGKVYKWPEYHDLSNEEKAELATVDGKSPAEWVDKHLEVGRAKLWRMAQADVADKAQQYVKNQAALLIEAHKAELEKTVAKYEKKLEKAITKTEENTRAAVLAEFATKGGPPKTPKKEPVAVVEEEDIDYTSFESIAESVKRGLAKGGGGGV